MKEIVNINSVNLEEIKKLKTKFLDLKEHL
jgi:hypothetical protein